MVGIFAWQLGGRALCLVPATFLLVMAAGGALGVAGIDVPLVDVGIAHSVIVLGAVVALGVEAPVAAAMALVGLFAAFHGHAHGVEMPETAAGLTYAIGFMATTGLLHALGIGAGLLIGKAGDRWGPTLARVAGGLSALAGVALLLGAI